MKKYFAKLMDPEFIIPVVIVAVVAVALWNTFAAPFIAKKTGKDLTA